MVKLVKSRMGGPIPGHLRYINFHDKTITKLTLIISENMMNLSRKFPSLIPQSYLGIFSNSEDKKKNSNN